jgi:hypothetical protein
MNPVLMIMQPRIIPPAITSIRENWNNPRVWFKAFTEPQVVNEMNRFVRESDYSHYIVISDDAICYKRAFDNVLANAPKYDVFTGWCNMEMYGDKISSHSNVSFHALPLIDENASLVRPLYDDYPPWASVDEVLSKEGNFQTAIASFATSCFTRDILLKYPLGVWENGKASDHHISYRLQKDRIPIWTSRDVFVRHLRQGRESYLKNTKAWLVGNAPSQIIYELDKKQYQFDGQRQYEYEPLFVGTNGRI